MDSLSTFFKENGTYLIYAPMIIFLVYVIVNILRGLRRGFRKNLILTAISAGAFVLAYLIFILVLRRKPFETFVLNLYKTSRGETLNETLNVSASYDRFKTIISAALEARISNENGKNVYQTFSPYVESLSECILGLIYMVFTFILWWFIYFFIGYLIIYNIFLSERKYKKSFKKYENVNEPQAKLKEEDEPKPNEEEPNIEEAVTQEDGSITLEEDVTPQSPKSEELVATPIAEAEDEPKVEEKKKHPVYKRRRLLGGLVGLFRGIIFGTMAISAFGTLFYISTGMKTDVYEKGETVEINYNGNTYDLTEMYKFIYEYDNMPFNAAMNNAKIDGVPIYASIGNMFCKGTLKVSEDGINTKIYPMKELAKVMEIMHEGVMLLDKYNLTLEKDNFMSEFTNLVDNDPRFVDDLYAFIRNFGSTSLHRALGRTVTNHFAELIESSGYSNKYTDVIFKGPHAINVDDLLTKEDIKQFINIASKAVALYQEYDNNSDIKDIIINKCNIVNNLTDEILKLSLFTADDKENLNGCVSDLLTIALEDNKKLSSVSFEGIEWFGNSGGGAVSLFITSLTKFLNCGILEYSGTDILFNLSKISLIFTSSDGVSSVSDDIKTSDALRRIVSALMTSSLVDGVSIYIAPSCKDSSGYINAHEFEMMFTSLGNIINDMNFESKGPVEISGLMDELVPLIVDDIQAFKNLADYVSESKVLSSIASRYIYDTLKVDYEIPSELVLDDGYADTNIENWLGDDGELHSLLRSICVVGTTADVSVNKVMDLADEDIEMLCSSKIVNVIVTKIIKELTMTDFTIIIPDTAYDGDFIKSSEILGIFHALKKISGYDSMTESQKELYDIETMELDPTNIITNDDVRNSLFESDIIEATISFQIATRFAGALSIPADLELSDANKDNLDKWMGSDGELYHLLNGINSLGIADSISETATDIDINTVLKNASIEDALESKILWYTVSDNIIKEEATNTYLAIPSDAYDGMVISKLEIINVFDAIKELQKNETMVDISSLDANMILSADLDLTVILKSYIIWFSISKAFIGTTGITMPNVSFVDKDAAERYVLKSEIINTIKALNALEQTDIEAISLDSNKFISLNDSDTQDILLASYVVWYEVSKQFILHVTNMPSNVMETVMSENYIIKNEIKALVNVLNILNITNISGYSIDPSLVIGLSNSDKEIIMRSYIARYEISIQLSLSDDFIITEEACEKIDGNVFISVDETLKVLSILSALEITGFTNISTNPVDIANKGLSGVIAQSVIMRATITDKVFYVGRAGLFKESVYQDKVYNENRMVYVLTELETRVMIDSLAIMNVTNVDSGINIDVYAFISKPSSDKNKVLDSYSVWLYISDRIFDMYTPESSNLEEHSIITYNTDEVKSVCTKEFIMSF